MSGHGQCSLSDTRLSDHSDSHGAALTSANERGNEEFPSGLTTFLLRLARRNVRYFRESPWPSMPDASIKSVQGKVLSG